MTESKYVNAFEAIDAVLTKLGYVNDKASEPVSKPKRIQRKRVKGWRMPDNAVYVGRPSKHGNPFKVGQWAKIGVGFAGISVPYYLVGNTPGDGHGWIYIDCAETAVSMFRKWRSYAPLSQDAKEELRGKDLACWCKLSDPCHADVLLELANS